MHGFHKFQDLWTWFIVKNGTIIDQGYDEDKEKARSDYDAAVNFWAVTDYERE